MAAPRRENDPKRRFAGNHEFGGGYSLSDSSFVNWDTDTAAQKRFAAHGFNKGIAGKMNLNKAVEESISAVKDSRHARKQTTERIEMREANQNDVSSKFGKKEQD